MIRAPDSLAKYIAHKGSICVDGTTRQSVTLKLDEVRPVADVSIIGVLVPGGNPLDPNDRNPA